MLAHLCECVLQPQRLFRGEGDLSFAWPNIDSQMKEETKKHNPKTNVRNTEKQKMNTKQ